MLRIKNSKLNGKISVIASKSKAHRIIICSALSDKKTEIRLNAVCEDVQRTINCVEELGAKTYFDRGVLFVEPIDIDSSMNDDSFHRFDVGESGTTFRFMLPIATSIYKNTGFSAKGRLPERPIKDMVEFLEKNDVSFDKRDLPFFTRNRLVFDQAYINATVSSQYISGILLASPLQKRDISINTIGEMVSRPYVDITLDVMKDFGVNVQNTDYGFYLEKSKYISRGYYEVEGDWSNAAFFMVAAAINKGVEIEIDNLNLASQQGDKKIVKILEDVGANVIVGKNFVKVSGNEVRPFSIDVSDIPDLLPCLCVLASKADGKSVLYNASRLKEKESDRLKSSMEMINSLGGKARITQDSIEIYSYGHLKGGTVDSYFDHRIAMSAAVASVICDEDVIIKGEDSVKKSYINFFEDFETLGGKICHL